TLARMILAEQQEIPVGPSAAEPVEQGGPLAGQDVEVTRSVLPAAAVISSEASRPELRIQVSHGPQKWEIEPTEFETFPFEGGDQLRVIPTEVAATLPVSWGNIHVEIQKGRAIVVAPRIEFFEFKGYKIPVHLINFTGAGPETLEQIGKAHIEAYCKHMGLDRHMTVIEVGCGIGRDAFQLLDLLGNTGRYVGIDVTRDSIIWCQ